MATTDARAEVQVLLSVSASPPVEVKEIGLDLPTRELVTFTVLVVGATGSIGRLVVTEALTRGHRVRALVRDRSRARDLPSTAEVVVGARWSPWTTAAYGMCWPHSATDPPRSP